MKGKVIVSRGEHALICDGWEYYDRYTMRRVGDKGKSYTETTHLGTFFKDADAYSCWLDFLKSGGKQ